MNKGANVCMVLCDGLASHLLFVPVSHPVFLGLDPPLNRDGII